MIQITTWYAQYYSTVATVAVNDIKYGNYKFYQMDKNDKWVYKRRMGAGYSLGGYSCGSYMLMGFKGVATDCQRCGHRNLLL